MKKTTVLGVMLLLLLVFMPLVSAEVVVFSKYDSSYNLVDGKLIVSKILRLKNVGDAPIIPGEIHFKLSQDGSDDPLVVEQFTAQNKDGKELDTKLVTTDSQTSLVFTVWDPLLPDFFYDVDMEYEIDFNPRGILFYSVILPEEKTTIPIRDSSVKIVLPKAYHFTYAPDADISTTDEGRVASWLNAKEIQFEYSVVPLPKLGFRAVNAFWIILMLIFLVQLFLKFRKIRGS